MEEISGGDNSARPLSMFIGGLSFIPLIGVAFGIIAVLRGLFTRRPGGRKLAALGAGGIGFTIMIYGALFYFGFVQRGGVYDHLRSQLAQTQLNSLLQSIEFYKVQHGIYPETLENLRASLPKNAMVFIDDPSDVSSGPTPHTFYYRRIGADHYYLRSVGPDRKPFTSDDLVPQFDPATAGKLGLLTTPPRN